MWEKRTNPEEELCTEKFQASSSASPFLSQYTMLTIILTPAVWGGFSHQGILCNASWVSYNLTQF